MQNTKVRIKGINEKGTIKSEYMTHNGKVIFIVITDSGKELQIPFNGIEVIK
jgi:cytochrome c-type biogenesis protein CcmE